MAKKDNKPTAKTKTAKTETKTSGAVKASEVVSKVKTANKEVKLAGPYAAIRKWNFGLAILLALQALAVIAFGKALSLPVTTQYPAVDKLASEANGHEVMAAATRHLFDVHIVWLVATFLLVLAVAYLAMATIFRARYERALQRGVSETRWVTLGVFGATVFVTIAMLSGIYLLPSLLMIAGFILAGCAALLAAEYLAQDSKKGIVSHLVCGVGAVSVLMPWLILVIAAVGALMYNGHVPVYVYGIYLSMGLFTVAAALLTHFRIKRRGKWADALQTEKAYMMLGFLAATVLAWQIFAGVLQ
jgi:hypothetical protein